MQPSWDDEMRWWRLASGHIFSTVPLQHHFTVRRRKLAANSDISSIRNACWPAWLGRRRAPYVERAHYAAVHSQTRMAEASPGLELATLGPTLGRNFCDPASLRLVFSFSFISNEMLLIDRSLLCFRQTLQKQSIPGMERMLFQLSYQTWLCIKPLT